MDDKSEDKKIIEATLKDLKREAIDLGMPEEDAELFLTKPPLLASINALKATRAKVTADKVSTLNPPEDPKEKRESEKIWKSKAEKMRDILENQPKTRILIPCTGKEKPGVIREYTKNGHVIQEYVSGSEPSVETVILNGFTTLIPKGVYVQVPNQVADVVSEQQQAINNAGAHILVDRADPETGKSVRDQLS